MPTEAAILHTIRRTTDLTPSLLPQFYVNNLRFRDNADPESKISGAIECALHHFSKRSGPDSTNEVSI